MKADDRMLLWFKNYDKWRYSGDSIFHNNIDKFKNLFIEAGFILEEGYEGVFLIKHPELIGKEHEWIFRTTMYNMIVGTYTTLYRIDAVKEYLEHVKDLLNESNN